MAQVLTSFQAYGIEADEALTKKWMQRVVLTGTGTTADVVYDFGAIVAGSLGTFWTAVSGTDPGKTALLTFQQISASCRAFIQVNWSEIWTRAKVTSLTAAGQYLPTIANKVPSVSFNAADGPTAWTVVIDWDLDPNTPAVNTGGPVPYV